jgi:glycosyltransferase involved in cell wall biosynthesis
MKIAVVNSGVPFVRGGAEHLADALSSRLRDYGHDAHLIRIPFQWVPPQEVLRHILACRLMRLEDYDLVIPLKFPVYFLQHENKVLWLLHQFRQAYDLWELSFRDSHPSREDLEMKRLVMEADNAYLPEAKRIYANSHVTAHRLKRFNGLDAEILYPPVFEPESFYSGDYGDYIFCPSRINSTKRQELLVDAMAYCRTPVRLVLAGVPEGPGQELRIREQIAHLGVANRVELLPRFIPEPQKLELLANSLAVAYVPYDEDSYGYVALEAYLARRPVVTCTDSGGILILVKDGLTGRVVEPIPQEIGAAFDRLYTGRNEARAQGNAGWELVESMEITWENVVRRLTGGV